MSTAIAQGARRLISISLAVVVVSACASGAGPRVTPTAPPTRNLVSRAELAAIIQEESAYAAVARIRPWFLRPRPGGRSARGQAPVIAVHVNGHPHGGVEVLRGLMVGNIERIELVPPEDGYQVLGGGRGADAVINVVLRSRIWLR